MSDEEVDAPEDTGESSGAAESPVERRWSKKSSSTRPAAPAQDETQPAAGDERSGELFDQLQRARADLSNYRKRVEAEREEMAKLASMFLVAELLPVLDNFERAIESIPKELEMFSWLQGIMLIERHLSAILERQGVQPIEALGQPFNPNLHEAIVEEESAETAPGTVIGELQKGYTMHGHVLRPTLAKISKVVEAAPAPSGGDDGELDSPA